MFTISLTWSEFLRSNLAGFISCTGRRDNGYQVGTNLPSERVMPGPTVRGECDVSILRCRGGPFKRIAEVAVESVIEGIRERRMRSP